MASQGGNVKRGSATDWDDSTPRGQTKEAPAWIGFGQGGKPYQKPRCWSDPDGCGKFVDSHDWDMETRLCKACHRAIEVRFQVTPGQVPFVLAFKALDAKAVQRVRSCGVSMDVISSLNQTQDERIRWGVQQMGNPSGKKDMQRIEDLSIKYFTSMMKKYGVETGKGSRLLK